MRRLILLLGCLTAFAASAQVFQGLNLNKGKKPSADAGVTAVPAPTDAGVALAPDAGLPKPDLADGDPVIAVPPTWGAKLDLENYKLLHAALKERVGARAVDDALTVATIEKQKLTAELTLPDAQKKLGAALKAELMVTFEVSLTQVAAKLLPRPGATPDAVAVAPTPKNRKLTPIFARALLAELIKKGHVTLEPPQGLDLTSGPAEPPPPPQVENNEDLDVPADVVRARVAPKQLKASWLAIYAGGGASFRSLDAVSQTTAVPGSPAAIAALGFDLKVFPLRLVSSLEGSKLAELWVEGQYRLNLAQATVDSGGTSTTCPVNDDELMGRVGYRYAFGGMLPHLGVTVGVANERTHFACSGVNTLDTTYTSTEYHLTVLQPILSGERLAIELAGGPRLLFSSRALGYQTLAWSAEGWITGRPVSVFTLRAGARVTGTRLTTYPDGISVLDLRTFVGLEIGAAL
jgi:hypothetical protein